MNTSKIILVTGGQRSGKSSFSEKLALSMAPDPIYMATAEVRDEEFRTRVKRHQQHRGPQWTTIEEPLHLSSHNLENRTVLIDCVTLWATKAFFEHNEDTQTALQFIISEFNHLVSRPGNYIFVSNELGMGGVADNPMMRAFTDLQGWTNQHIARHADEVYLMVAGIPLPIKKNMTSE